MVTGYTYNAVPAFSVVPGDTIAFDLGNSNDMTICRSIYIATPASLVGSCSTSAMNVGGPGWTQIVSLYCPSSRGNTALNDYDLVYRISSSFSFPGGQMLLAISAVGAAADSSCDQVLVCATCNDASTNFINRFYGLSSLVTSITGSFDTTVIPGFQITSMLEIL